MNHIAPTVGRQNAAALDRHQAQANKIFIQRREIIFVGDLVDRVFGGSAARLMMQALSGRTASQGEIAEIRRMLDDYESQESGAEGARK